MWYGYLNPIEKRKLVSHSKKLFHSRNSLYYKQLVLFFPRPFQLILLKHELTSNLVLAALSEIYYFKVPLPKRITGYGINTQTNSLLLHFKNWGSFLPLFSKSLSELFRLFSLPLFFKLKFKGKGYYVFKNKRNTISPQFGFSHRLHLYSFSLVVRFLSKTKVFLIGFSKTDLFKTANAFKNMKPINVFTGRGVRFARQIVYRKTGKVSLYR